MSYLVDALKRAERERHQQRGADMQSLSAMDDSAHKGNGGATLRWVVLALVVCNVGLLAYFFFPANKTDAVGTDTNQTAVPAQDAPSTRAEVPNTPEKNRVYGELAMPESKSRDVTRPAPESNSPQRSSPPADRTLSDDLRLSGDPASARGQVTYSQSPLENGSAFPPSEQNDAPPLSDMGGTVPSVTINGQLYSSVPGRSFILVNGRRYHEGERLAVGPAVESIDASGATLNYRGQRYHVDGPG